MNTPSIILWSIWGLSGLIVGLATHRSLTALTLPWHIVWVVANTMIGPLAYPVIWSARRWHGVS